MIDVSVKVVQLLLVCLQLYVLEITVQIKMCQSS